MIVKTSFELGGAKYGLEVEEKSNMETLHQAIVLSNPPRYCNACKNDKYFVLDSNKDKEGNIYINVVCKSCFAKAKLGQYKAGGYFWHKFETYNKNKADQGEAQLPVDQVPF